MVTSDLKSLLLPVCDRINCIIGTKWLKNKNCQTNFFELFPPEGDQMFEQIVQGSWIISILGDFQIVRQVLEPPSLLELLLRRRFYYRSPEVLVKPDLFCDSRKGSHQRRNFKVKSRKCIFVIIQRHLESYRCLIGTSFSVYLLLRGKDKSTFSDTSCKQCEKRSAEFADTHI